MIRNRKQFSAWMIGLLALSLSACGESEVMQNTTPDEDPLANDPTRREIVLGFQNKLSIKTAGTTRADAPIATTEENEISTLDIYVFSSDKEEGPYTYQERFSYRADGTTVTGSTKIVLTMEGDNVALATLRPKKGLFTKFYCIANQPTLLKAGTVYDVFTPLEQSSPGADHNIVTKAGVPTETDFLTFTTPLLDPATPDDVLLTPLPMVGSYSPALDLRDISMGSRTRINMTLSRIVSRFDIINDAEKSHLTITSVSMGKGRKGVTFFPVVPVEDLTNPAKTLITYPDRDFDGDNANTGTQTGAFYSYPSPIDDKGYLIIKGKYALNLTDAPQDVSYMVEFEQSVGGTGGYIEVKPNHRYTVRITDADPFKLDVNITVSDWTDGGDIDYQPENELTIGVLTADGSTTIEDGNKATVVTTETDYFSIPFTSNSEAECSIVYSTSTGVADADWLKAVVTKDPATRAGSAAYTCKVSKKDGYTGNVFPKATILLRSKAGREESQITVEAKLNVPTVAAVATDPSVPAAANSYTPGTETPAVITGTLSMQKQATAGTTSSMKLTVTAKGGSRIVGLPAWLKVDKATGHATEAIEYTFTLDQNAKGFPTGPFPVENAATFEIQNLSDATKKVEVTVKVTEP